MMAVMQAGPRCTMVRVQALEIKRVAGRAVGCWPATAQVRVTGSNCVDEPILMQVNLRVGRTGVDTAITR
ncbi:hypothetical protein [Nocardia arthritidis]|uniref:Uncharacterized protein n=1 Tax=Nocardia arthritidis TaxID=228602 RepID=A0A6G9Y6Y5_9NOCA|nr:hypothetical protein [Nocardia arthritidis]QIS08836.1 hypothetical protein F5544_04610 [Nocardia arthritidis]